VLSRLFIITATDSRWELVIQFPPLHILKMHDERMQGFV
jgi:hypothetical protein